MIPLDSLLYPILALFVVMVAWRTIRGRTRFPALLMELEEEGLLRRERGVLTRFNFPLIKKITWTRIYLTEHRFLIVHWFTLSFLLQAPVGAEGAPGTEKARFEVESKGRKKRLLLRTTIRGGGKIRFHLADPEDWFRTIKNG